MSDHASVVESRCCRLFWIGGRCSPLAVIVVAFGLFDLAPLVLRSLFTVLEIFQVGNPRIKVVLKSVSLCAFESARMQVTMLAIWFVFGHGRWWSRLAIGWMAACGFAIGTPFSVGMQHGAWTAVVRSAAALPFILLARSAPLVAWRLCSGRKLVHQEVWSPRGGAPSVPHHFTILDVMAATAVVAVAANLRHWSAVSSTEPSAALLETAYRSLSDFAWSTVYVVPLIWAALVIRWTTLSLSLLTILVVAFYAIYFELLPRVPSFGTAADFWPQVASTTGTILTVPCGLFLWRQCGYRLAAPERGEARGVTAGEPNQAP